jgi:hypothetical protein
VGHGFGEGRDLPQHAVDAEADPDGVLLRFECTSDARSRKACVRSRFTACTTGACSSTTRRGVCSITRIPPRYVVFEAIGALLGAVVAWSATALAVATVVA